MNRPLVRALGDEGLLERVLPSEGEGSAVELCLLREGLAERCTEAETALALQGLGGYPILRAARPELSRGMDPEARRGRGRRRLRAQRARGRLGRGGARAAAPTATSEASA